MKLAWLTDIHLNFLDDEERRNFYQKISASGCDAVLITGDIAEAVCVVELLKEMVDMKVKSAVMIGCHFLVQRR